MVLLVVGDGPKGYNTITNGDASTKLGVRGVLGPNNLTLPETLHLFVNLAL